MQTYMHTPYVNVTATKLISLLIPEKNIGKQVLSLSSTKKKNLTNGPTILNLCLQVYRFE